MRPVLLEMDGFASFRQRTSVNFDDVDYFALVGATGAGKSTVIDAITFALYGSVARWDDQGAVAPALAPTVNRGTVRLVFDVRGARYQVLRELRRDGNGKVATKTARLERLLESDALGDIDDPIELLAGSLRRPSPPSSSSSASTSTSSSSASHCRRATSPSSCTPSRATATRSSPGSSGSRATWHSARPRPPAPTGSPRAPTPCRTSSTTTRPTPATTRSPPPPPGTRR